MTVYGSLYRMWILYPQHWRMLSVPLGTTGFFTSVQGTPIPTSYAGTESLRDSLEGSTTQL